MSMKTRPGRLSLFFFTAASLLAILACSVASPLMVPPTIPATTSALLPDFPWPPPTPSAIASLTLGSVGRAAGAGSTFADVDARITEALTAAGYDERAYYGLPNGFAVVTGLEQVDANGYSMQAGRWVSHLTPMSMTDFSLGNYLAALFGAPKGYYRTFVFLVTSDLVVQSGTPVSQAEAGNWVIEGANKLPDSLKALSYTKDHTCTVYVYEFIQSGMGAQANLDIPSSITGRQHLERAGLWNILEKVP